MLTAGAIAHGEGLDVPLTEDVRVRPITRESEPSPFSRVGPGIDGATKPDLVNVGGTLVFDPVVARLRRGEDLASPGVLTLHHTFLEGLFTAGSGTSYAAPRVAFSAAQILSRLPDASANLLRALLVGSAEIPTATHERMRLLGDDATRTVCGHGQVDLERAAFSDDARVVLYGEDELASGRRADSLVKLDFGFVRDLDHDGEALPIYEVRPAAFAANNDKVVAAVLLDVLFENRGRALHRAPFARLGPGRERAIEAAGEVGERTLLLGPLAVVLENQVGRAAPNEPEAHPDARRIEVGEDAGNRRLADEVLGALWRGELFGG